MFVVVSLSASLHAQTPPTLKAVMGQPVLQELMGGCFCDEPPWKTVDFASTAKNKPVRCRQRRR